MSTLEISLTIAVIVAGTIFTRAFPFILFPGKKEPPPFITYLGVVLPMAAIGMLVVYCFRHVTFVSRPYAIPEVIGFLFVVLIHRWRHNLFLSIGGGTILYMAMIQSGFPFSLPF